MDTGKITLGGAYESPFLNRVGVFQDGTVPFCRDRDGTLWALSGHSHMGHIGVFAGHDLADMKELYPAQFNFATGHADFAFNGIRYPEGIRARGSVWPFGLYICPKTNRFFAFFHNETGWKGRGTAYDANGLCETPKLDSDFRHVGLMHSDDRGQSWTFDRWVLTASTVACSERFVPDSLPIAGQKEGVICLGSGDFSLFAPKDSEYLYFFYNMIRIDIVNWQWVSCDVYLARARQRQDGVMGDCVKYFDGGFCEAGNLGCETAIITNAWHPRVVYAPKWDCYLMTATLVIPGSGKIVEDEMLLFTSRDLIHWSEPVRLTQNGRAFGNHYNAICSYHAQGDPYVLTDDAFTLLTCHNGTDVMAYDGKLDL